MTNINEIFPEDLINTYISKLTDVSDQTKNSLKNAFEYWVNNVNEQVPDWKGPDGEIELVTKKMKTDFLNSIENLDYEDELVLKTVHNKFTEWIESNDLTDKVPVDKLNVFLSVIQNQLKLIIANGFYMWLGTLSETVGDEVKSRFISELNNIDWGSEKQLIIDELVMRYRGWVNDNGLGEILSPEHLEMYVEFIKEFDYDETVLVVRKIFRNEIIRRFGDWMDSLTFKFDDQQLCEYPRDKDAPGMINMLRTYFSHNNNEFWIIFGVSILLLLILPTMWKLGKYNNTNWDQVTGSGLSAFFSKLPLSPEDVSLTLVNIILFIGVSMGLFYFALSKDISRILEGNFELYLNIIKTDKELTNTIIKIIDETEKRNAVEFKKYDDWKNKCNGEFNRRPLIYGGIIFGILLLFLGYVFYRTDYSFDWKNPSFWFSMLLIGFVFSTEIYMLFFVFTKVIVVGEIELPHKFLHKLSDELQT